MLLKLISIDKNNSKPIYRQLSDAILTCMSNGVPSPGSKMPGTRIISKELNIHRQTVVAAYDELISQGWLTTLPSKGTFVARQLPDLTPAQWSIKSEKKSVQSNSLIAPSINRNLRLTTEMYHLDDGLPDPRLAPMDELSKAIKDQLTSGNLYNKFQYADTKGNTYLRTVLLEYLEQTRNLKVDLDQIMITRGVTQSLFLSINCFLHPGDKVVVTKLSWESANVNFKNRGIDLITIDQDNFGMNVDQLAELCKKDKIAMVYITPHHHYPTTVIMPAYRRIQLIELARKHDFLIFEDDYDYDFHFSSHPIMPLAAATHNNHVIYTGSFTKAIAPAFRVGYLVANAQQIDHLSKFRRLVDRQGDSLLEAAIANLIKSGTMQRYLRRNRKMYLQRRDILCHLLKEKIPEMIQFDVPDGGMALWAKFHESVNLKTLVNEASLNNLYIQDEAAFRSLNLNRLRLGYASSNEKELTICVDILKKLLGG